jgi:hypothetical protein
MNDLDHISQSLINYFLGLNHLKSLMWIREPGWKTSIPGSGMKKKAVLQVWDVYLGSDFVSIPDQNFFHP